MRNIVKESKALSALTATHLVLISGNFAWYSILARSLDSSVFADYILMISFSSVLEIARTGLISNGLIKNVQQHVNEADRVVWAGFVIWIASTTILACLIIFMGLIWQSLYASSQMQSVCMYHLLPMLGFSFLTFSQVEAQARMRYQGLSVRYFIAFSFSLSASIIYIGFSDSIDLKMLQVIMGLSTLFASLPYIGRLVIKPTFGFRLVYWIKKLLKHGKYVLGSNLLSMSMSKLDVFIIYQLAGDFALAVYHVATRLLSYLDMPLQLVSQYYYPKLAAATNDLQKLSREQHQLVAIMYSMIIPMAILVFVFTERLARMVGGENYASEAALLMIILIPASLIKPVGRLLGMSLDAIGQPNKNLNMMWQSLGIQFLVTLLFVHLWGVYGAAFSVSVGIALTTLLGYHKHRKVVYVGYSSLIQYCQKTINQLIKNVWNLYLVKNK